MNRMGRKRRAASGPRTGSPMRVGDSEIKRALCEATLAWQVGQITVSMGGLWGLEGSRAGCSRGGVNVRGRARTCNLRLRRPTLYPIELRGQGLWSLPRGSRAGFGSSDAVSGSVVCGNDRFYRVGTDCFPSSPRGGAWPEHRTRGSDACWWGDWPQQRL